MSEPASLFFSIADELNVSRPLQEAFIHGMHLQWRPSRRALSAGIILALGVAGASGYLLGTNELPWAGLVVALGVLTAIIAVHRARAREREMVPKNVDVDFLRAAVPAVKRDEFEAMLVAATKSGLLVPRLLVVAPGSKRKLAEYEGLEDVPNEVEDPQSGERLLVTPEMLHVLFNVHSGNG